MNIGNGSVSLNVANLNESIVFYENLGFTQSGGNIDQRYIIMQNDTITIGLFEGMLEKNMLTFNPKWDRDCQTVNGQDVRDIHEMLVTSGYEPDDLGIDSSAGPNYFMVKDPDGNVILIDQHV